MHKFFTLEVRRYTYILGLAVAGALVYFGKMEPEALVVVTPLLLALFNLTPDDVVSTRSITITETDSDTDSNLYE